MRLRTLSLGAVASSVLATTSQAQGPGFVTPGMPGQNATSQVDRFSNNFNPALGAVFDMRAGYVDESGGSDQDGFDLTLRTAELDVSSWVDPSAWAYGVVVFTEDQVDLEEGAIQYIGFDSNLAIRGGRFFVDFGKLMQAHVHDLRTLNRPPPLATYLGEELSGDGFQLDDWFAAGDTTVVRYSLGVFGSLIREEGLTQAVPFDQEQKQLDELALTGRITGFRDAGERGTLQAGLSARYIPDYGFRAPGSGDPGGEVSGLSNAVFGLDLTYGWMDESTVKTWTTGGELLVNTGDVSAEVDDNILVGDPSDDLVDVQNDTLWGGYAFVDHRWTVRDSAGVQLSYLQLPQAGRPELAELELYFTRYLSEFQRLRFVVQGASSDVDPDALRLVFQWTGFIGAHAHGLNW